MAKIFDQYERVVPTWLAVSRYLLDCPEREAQNLVLEIANPAIVKADERILMAAVDSAIRAHKPTLSLATIQATIFPQHLYNKHGRPGLYEAHRKAINRAGYGWGTYAGRMMRRQSKNGKGEINPLDMLIEKLKLNASAEAKQSFVSTFELGVTDVEDDLRPACLQEAECGAELPTYDAARDAKRNLGYPCLSHVSFKLVGRTTLNMTAIYRSHYYCERALGNLLGLAQLLMFVAKEAGVNVGTLTCLSTHAKLDTSSWGGVDKTKQILA